MLIGSGEVRKVQTFPTSQSFHSISPPLTTQGRSHCQGRSTCVGMTCFQISKYCFRDLFLGASFHLTLSRHLPETAASYNAEFHYWVEGIETGKDFYDCTKVVNFFKGTTGIVSLGMCQVVPRKDLISNWSASYL